MIFSGALLLHTTPIRSPTCLLPFAHSPSHASHHSKHSSTRPLTYYSLTHSLTPLCTYSLLLLTHLLTHLLHFVPTHFSCSFTCSLTYSRRSMRRQSGASTPRSCTWAIWKMTAWQRTQSIFQTWCSPGTRLAPPTAFVQSPPPSPKT